MKAIVYHRYGAPDVVAVADLPKPAPAANEVLVRIRATTVSTGDWRARSLSLPPGFGLMGRLVFGVFGPRQPILGTELAGVVEAIGSAVTRFAPGDEVFAFVGGKFGCHAEYRTIAEDGMVARKPPNLSFEETAALSFGGMTALSFLRDKGRLKAGEKVLVVGASGAVGTAAVQIAIYLGAEVTGVCSAVNLRLVTSLGADRVIDYAAEDFAAEPAAYDVILDTTGSASFSRVEHTLKPGGRLLIVLGSFAEAVGLRRPSKASGKTIVAGVSTEKKSDLELLAELASAGIYKPVIDRCYPLEHAAEAHAYVETGRKRGSVVLVVDPAGLAERLAA